ncbi:hypothetical protein N7508_006046 [Penicillium antarcticum]|uniref:uncharacterized protein n=1 Tax=Penicillium antarcticum TaxID=416450 RepID=UPI00238F4DA9|nr:uncharacterized protein N7508_006046 [Penicillium antarcticum]KAJ5307031.1 hypothetical protein N7508_006046 [Penicillium antarcticum]
MPSLCNLTWRAPPPGRVREEWIKPSVEVRGLMHQPNAAGQTPEQLVGGPAESFHADGRQRQHGEDQTKVEIEVKRRNEGAYQRTLRKRKKEMNFVLSG